MTDCSSLTIASSSLSPDSHSIRLRRKNVKTSMRVLQPGVRRGIIKNVFVYSQGILQAGGTPDERTTKFGVYYEIYEYVALKYPSLPRSALFVPLGESAVWWSRC
eukprot:700297-Hanusia_phi.AAC.2